MGYLLDLRKIVGNRPLISVGATVLVMNARHELLFQYRSDTHSWGLPGGSMEPGETLEEVAIRELQEETGLQALSVQLLDVFSGPDYFFRYPNGDQTYSVIHLFQAYSVIHLFQAKGVSGTLQMTDGESLNLRYFKLDQLPDPLEARAAALLKQIIPRLVKTTP
ncbi:NUDIX hydrolase [Exiguobacterium acetylicum]|uniref:NUDIX hydrolase n=1 Tax=Exiguobacterium acetylicum TaxID=41170 RepID=UPI001EE1CE39|nr:NUDIX hydrolase [Exiguobacterium acetylicum]UKS55864.1 NUDIX hydrolase [Exiguobacterium acetylicum]